MNREPSELMYLEREFDLCGTIIIIAKILQIICRSTVKRDLRQAVQTVRKNRIEERLGLYSIFLNTLVRFANESFMWFGSFTVIQSNPVITFGFGIGRTRCECWGLGYTLKSYSLSFTLLFVFDPLCLHYCRHLLDMVSNNRGCISVWDRPK